MDGTFNMGGHLFKPQPSGNILSERGSHGGE